MYMYNAMYMYNYISVVSRVSLFHYPSPPFGCRRGHDFSSSKLQVLYVVEHCPFPETEQFVMESVKRSAYIHARTHAQGIKQSILSVWIAGLLDCINFTSSVRSHTEELVKVISGIVL